MASNLITIGELLLYPTGLDWNTLAEKIGLVDQTPSSAAQAVEQTQIIRLASEWAANYCNMPRGLQATQQTETQRIVRTPYFGAKAWSDKGGWLQFKAQNLPIISVDQLQFALSPGPLVYNDITSSMSAIIAGEYPQFLRVEENSRDWTWTKTSAAYLQIKYTAGYGNAILKAAVTAGASRQLTLDTTLGFAITNTQNPEMLGFQNVVNIMDSLNTEYNVPVISVDDATHITVGPLANAHDPTTGNGLTMGIGVSAVPTSIKLAVIMAATHYAKARGAQTMSMASAKGMMSAKSSTEILSEAEFTLEPWVMKF